MINKIIADVGHEQTRIALMQDMELVELHIENSRTQSLVGNIYRGKVCSVLPGMQAAFVDIGHEKNAFLYVGDVVSNKFSLDGEQDRYKNNKELRIDELLKPGQEITVQVIKEPLGSKGPRVTTQITLPGRYLVLLPNEEYVGVSRRIEKEDERNRLKQIAEKMKPEGKGVIVRTAAEGKQSKDFSRDIKYLMKSWNNIKEKEKKGRVPRCLYKDIDLISRTARDLFTNEIEKFIINDYERYQNVLELVEMISPALKYRVEYFSKDYDLFEYYQIENQIVRGLARKVWLKCGGYLVIDKTEALTVIDVNTGKYTGKRNLEDTVLRTNIEAAKEISKQIRLRDIGGIIVIDFIDMNEHEHQAMVLDTLRQCLKEDRTKTTVVGMTGLGLIEITRKKVRKELESLLKISCPYCGGTGKIISPEFVVSNMEKEISMYFSQTPANALKVKVHPSLAPILKNNYSKKIAKIENVHDKKIIIEACDSVGYGEIKIKEIDINSLVC